MSPRAPRPSALAPLAALLLGAGPWEAEHARSREAREALAAGAPERALPAYGALEQELGARPEIAVGKGAALLGLEKHAEARAAFEKARAAPEPLGSRALLGLGNALAGQGDLDGAVGAYREALGRDPASAPARHNLEVALRRRAEAAGAQQPRPDHPPDPGDAGPQGGGASAPGPQEQEAPGKAGPQGSGPEQAREEPQQGRGPAGPAGEERREREQGGAAPGGTLARQEAERLLDAMRAREKNLPAQPARPRNARSADAARDW